LNDGKDWLSVRQRIKKRRVLRLVAFAKLVAWEQ
jgi:hypothetical protein